MAAYDRHLQNLVLTLAATAEPAVLALSEDANHRVLHLERTLEPRLAPEAELGHITDWASKLTGATTRIAGLLHLAAGAGTGDIPAASLDAAARLGHYYLAHALAVFDSMAADPLVDDAAAVLDWILRTEQTRFTRRAAFTGLSRSRFRTVADLDPALDHLVDHGFIRPMAAPAPRRGRPPSIVFEVHPSAAKTAKAAEIPWN